MNFKKCYSFKKNQQLKLIKLTLDNHFRCAIQSQFFYQKMAVFEAFKIMILLLFS